MTPSSLPSLRSAALRASCCLLIAAAGVCVGCKDDWGKGTQASAASAMTADRILARKMAFEITTTANGELEARNKVEIRNPLDQESTIVRIVPEGTRVKAGDVLIQLNVEEIQIKVDEEKLKVESARAAWQVAKNAYEIQEKENDSKLRQAELKVELAELALRQWAEGDQIKRYRELELAADKAVIELQRLAEMYTRSQNLNAEGFVSKNQMDMDEVAYIEAIAKYKTSKLALEVYQDYERIKDQKKFESDVASAREELDKARLNSRSELESKGAQVNNTHEQFLGLDRKLAKLTKQRDDATIHAERDGLVVYGTSVDKNSWMGRGGGDSTLTIGTQVAPNQLLMILPDTSQMLAAVRVHESLAGRIRTGQDVSVKIDAAGGMTFSGNVESVGVMAEGGGWRDPNLREYTVRIALDTQGGVNLKPAMRCEARIILDNVPEAISVPVQAIFNEGPVQFVYVAAGSKFERKPVKVGRRSDTLAEIVKGLEDLEQVLLREPASGEVLAGGLSSASLVAAGYKIDDSGKVIAEGGMRSGSPGGGKPSQGGKPSGMPAGKADGQPQPKQDAKAPSAPSTQATASNGTPSQPATSPASPAKTATPPADAAKSKPSLTSEGTQPGKTR